MEQTSFVPVLRFAVSSDAHIKQKGDVRCARVKRLIKKSYETAAENEKYAALDAFIMVGDTANSGLFEQFDAFFKIINGELKEDTRFLSVMAKYHDCGQGREKDLNYFKKLSGLETDFHTVINGFHFIGISVCPDEGVFHYSDEQTAWLEEEIEKAVCDGPEKPVFVLQHEHVRHTVYGSYALDGWGEIYFSDILKKYPNVFHISGHSHYPASDPRALWQGEFTALNVGGLSYYEFTFDGERKYHPENSESMAQGALIEVSAENTVRVRILDLNENKTVKEYFIEHPAEPALFTYTNEKRMHAASPAFPENAKISCEKTENGYAFTFPPAICGTDDAVFLYRYTVTDSEGGETVGGKILSDYYYRSTPQPVRIEAPLPDGEYGFCVTAVSVWGKTSAPLKL